MGRERHPETTQATFRTGPTQTPKRSMSNANYLDLVEKTEEMAGITGLRREEFYQKISRFTQQEIDAKAEESDVYKHDGSIAMTGKFKAGTFSTPLDVTSNRKYGMEMHWYGNNYDVTGLRSRASLRTTDASTRTAQGAELQAANADGIDAGVLNGAIIEALGKSSSTSATITTMRGLLVNTEWSAKDTITNLKIAHIRTHTRDSATEGYVSGTSYGIYIENEAVGGNGQMIDAAIYLKGTNLSAGIKAFDYGIDFSGADINTAEIKFHNGETIDNLTDGIVNITGSVYIGDGGATNYLEIKADGEINLHGTARVTVHVEIPAGDWHRGASAPAESDVGIFHTLAFDATSDDEVHYIFGVPFKIAAGSTITVKVDWCYTGTQDNGTVCWALEFINVAEGEAVDGSTTTITGTSGGSHATGKRITTTLNTGVTGSVAHDLLGLHLYRDISADTLSTDAEMIKVHLDILSDKLGEAT